MPRSTRMLPDGEDLTPQQDSSENAQATPVEGLPISEMPTVEQLDAMMPQSQGLSAAEVVRQAMEDEARKQAERDAAMQAASAKPKVVHIVVSGDTLSGIADQYYGKAGSWQAIYEANKDVIGDNPNLIQVGQELFIPEL